VDLFIRFVLFGVCDTWENKLAFACQERELGDDERTLSASSELDIASLHSVEVIALCALGSLLDHAVPMRQFAIEDVAEDLGIAVGMGGETGAACDSVFIKDSERSKMLELGVVVACE